MRSAKILICALLLGAMAEKAAAVPMDQCEIDTMMQEMGQAIMDAERDFIDQGIKETGYEAIEGIDVKNGSCLDSLDNLGGMLNTRMPNFGGVGDLFDKIVQMVCDAVDGYIGSTIESIEFGVSDPYGIAGVGVKGSTSGSSMSNETYDLGEVVEDAVLDGVGDQVRDTRRNAPRLDMPQNRAPRAEGQGVGSGVYDAIKGL